MADVYGTWYGSPSEVDTLRSEAACDADEIMVDSPEKCRAINSH
jgi:hypothetical protein